MSLEKVLQKIQSGINEIAPTLELFLEDTIQPSVSDCEELQQQLTLLQENLAVYKYNKLNKELSPSFNIHARVSEVQVPDEIETHEPEHKVNHAPAENIEEKTAFNEPKKENTSPSKRFPNLIIGLNDKFRFINELFAQNSSEYHIAMEQLNNLRNWSDTEIYLNSLKSLYEWRDNSEVAKYFYSLVKKRFD